MAVRSRLLQRGGHLGAILCGASLVVTGCASPGATEASAGGEGVPPGATEQEYAAALADMEPITLTTQSPESPGDAGSRAAETYAKAIEEWSDGKITVEIAYGNAIAPAPDEIDDALADGRLDFNVVIPQYDPARYPTANALTSVSFLGDQSPVVGVLETNAGLLEAALKSEGSVAEMEASDIKVMLPNVPMDLSGMSCSSPRAGLDALQGTQGRVGAKAHMTQVEALGMSGVSLPYTEAYEALQRGTIDCTISSLRIINLTGTIPVAPHFVIDPDVGLSGANLVYGFSLATWEGLPLAVQQLLYDRLDAFIEGSLRAAWQGGAEALAKIEDSGGSVTPFDDEARAALRSANEQIVDSVRNDDTIPDGDALVRNLTDSVERWHTLLTDELGYRDDIDYNDFVSSYSEDDLDLEPYIDRLFTDLLNDHRPGNED